MQTFTAFDLQRHIGKVQQAAFNAPVAITHHGQARLVLMDYDRWQELGRGDVLARTIRVLQAQRQELAAEGITSVSIFGSVARGDAGPESDIDLLVQTAPGVRVGGLKLAHWRRRFTNWLGQTADVVVEEFLDENIRASIGKDMIQAVVVQKATSNAA